MQTILTSIGHVLGFVSVGLFFYSYQCTEKRKLMVIQTVATALSCVQYLLIGAFSGFALNLVCIIRNLAFYFRDKYKRTDLVIPVIFSVCMAAASVFSWEGTHTLLITAGLVVNTMCMGMFGAKDFRKTILISSSLILAYNLFAASYSGMLSESISLVSVIIGIIRFSASQKTVRVSQKPLETKKKLAA